MNFLKMHGLGNDYVYLDAVSRPELESHDLPDLARRISDRHRGVGGDGLILACAPRDPRAHLRMRIFNRDGSEAQMCGNGVRCLAKLAHERLQLRHDPLLVETGRGLLAIRVHTESGLVTRASVDMGAPILDPELIPVRLDATIDPRCINGVWAARLRVAGRSLDAAFVSMGNPHAVILEIDGKPLTRDALDALDLAALGPAVEQHPAFPQRVNAHAVFLDAHDAASMRTWERGAGLTQACGTGACAVLVAAASLGRLDRRATLNLPGGNLDIHWTAPGAVIMTGPAELAFEGTWK